MTRSGGGDSHGDAVAQTDGDAVRVPAGLILKSTQAIPVLTGLINEANASLLFQARQNALCHALHPIDARYCRWLLQASNALESLIDLTQESCAHALGVQRTSISMVAHAFQLRGGIRTRRGKIEILDPSQLEAVACECYQKLKRHAQARNARRLRLDRGSDEAFLATAR